ncbi:MAG: hypothetical protein COA78_24330 [Blastopirellula sp.]|nr:MAG: hypothetical protein COA78_24330 [Blastopirellula sp.]
MEYLEITGNVTLKADFDENKVNAILSQLSNIDCVLAGFIEIGRNGNDLSINADGEITESNSIEALFLALEDQLAFNSSFKIFRVRWEFYVILMTAPLPTKITLDEVGLAALI